MLDKAYAPAAVEAKWREAWRKAGLFRSEPEGDPARRFVIVIPPPNVTGALHIGHALDNALQDVLIRWHRLKGREACWVPGTDHGGIATQNVMEKQLKAEGKSRQTLGRGPFLERMKAWTRECQGTILGQLERLGCALDWDRTAFTMDETRARAVEHAFRSFWERGLLYRDERMVNWCVRCGTALSDSEVEYEERKGRLWRVRYPAEDGSGALVVATTRPETMFGDRAVAVNPKDPRYKALVGRRLRLPLTDSLIPVVADEHVDSSFGTGALKVTPAHDPNDFEIWQRHKAEMGGPIKVIDLEGRMSSAAGAAFAGLSREKARDKAVADLEAGGFLEKSEEHRHSVGVCYRCAQVIEPLLSEQWFLKMEPLARKAAEAAETGAFSLFPDSWGRPYAQWLKSIRDWCLSRQIWWGHRIPVWYCGQCLGGSIRSFWAGDGGETTSASVRELLDKGFSTADIESRSSFLQVSGISLSGGGSSRGVAVRRDRPEPCPDCRKDAWIQDPDVLDTWFSSALWPLSVFGWPEPTKDLKFYYPTSVLVTGYEILYLWVARMQMMGLEFAGKPPFAHALIHGIVRDKKGKKMSKSLGNVVDPLLMMDKYGTDALRFSLIAQAHPGRDIPFDEDSITGPRNFVNKLWNSTRFVLMNLPEGAAAGGGAEGRELADHWILSEFRRVSSEVEGHMERYELAAAANSLYGFLWDSFCDWYIELAKLRLTGPDGPSKRAAQWILVRVLTDTLKLLHPFMPYATEELYQALKPYAGESAEFLLRSKAHAAPPDSGYAAGDCAPMREVMAMTGALRALRSQLNVPPGLKLKVVYKASGDALAAIKDCGDYLRHLARLDSIEPGPRPPQSATAVAGQAAFYVPLEGLIDFGKERQRLAKELDKLAVEQGRLDAQLGNASFIERAPKEEVERIRGRHKELSAMKASLSDTLSNLT